MENIEKETKIQAFSFDGVCGTFEVIKVIDGDTVSICVPLELNICNTRKSGNFKLNVRLLGINTPEKKDQGYSEAKERLKELVEKCNNKVYFKRKKTQSRLVKASR